MTPIIIESSPTSILGKCYIGGVQPVTFTIVSGITSTSVSFEWFVNNISVGVGTSYTLTTPSTNDDVYVRVVDCPNVSGLRFGDWVEDNMFYLNDIIENTTQTYNIDMNASFSYKILSIVLQSDSTIDNVSIKINGVSVVWTDGTLIDVTSGIGDTAAVSSNIVLIGNNVTLVTSGVDGSPIMLRGKIRFVRYIPLSPVPPTTTTTSTTTLPPGPTTTTTTGNVHTVFIHIPN